MVVQDLDLGLSTLKPGLAELEPLVRPWSILGSSLVRAWLALCSSLVQPWCVLGGILGIVLGLVLGLSLACPFFRNSKNSNKQLTEASEPFALKAGGPQGTSP